jgi:simple sugar transport system ATP-binding protein
MTGLLGSGRTEVMESIFGYRHADSGKIIMDGAPVEIKSVNDAMAHGIGYVPEDRLIEGLFLEQSIEENISVAKWDSLTNHFMLDKKAMGELAQYGVGQFHIVTDDVKKTVQTLSGGNQQKAVLARWLARDLKVLILNGPTVGVDIGAKYDIHGIIRELAKKGMAVIVISDDLPEILENCNRVLIMNAGMIKGELVPSETDQAELTSLIMGG